MINLKILFTLLVADIAPSVCLAKKQVELLVVGWLLLPARMLRTISPGIPALLGAGMHTAAKDAVSIDEQKLKK